SPPPSGFFHSTEPFALSTAQRERLPFSATFRKIWLRQMIGVDPLQPGIATFQTTFSSVLHLTGRFFSLLTPLSAGPRHCGQFYARATTNEIRNTATTPTNRFNIPLFLRFRRSRLRICVICGLLRPESR